MTLELLSKFYKDVIMILDVCALCDAQTVEREYVFFRFNMLCFECFQI